MDLPALLESTLNASPTAAIFTISVIALLVAWQALRLAAKVLPRDKGKGE